jgi:hypothetical protein
MAHPRIEVLGAYRMQPNDDLFSSAMEIKYGGLKLSPAERTDAERCVREELESVALIELRVVSPDERYDTGDFGQPGSDQVAYLETYLSPDGEQVVSRDIPPSATDFRVAFFLHFFDPAQPLRTSYGNLTIPPLRTMPPRLVGLVRYEPVD